jgi:hypothetical protein
VAWERCDAAGANCVPIAGAAGTAYQLLAADVGHTIVVADTASNVDGTVSAFSQATAVIVPAPPRWLTLPVIAQDPGSVGDAVSVIPGTWSAPAPTSDTVQMMRCTNTCTVAATLSGAHPSYTIAGADAGAVLRVAEIAVNSSGQTAVWSSWFIGPVGSTVVAAGTLAGSAQVTLRNTQGRALAYASVGGVAGAADVSTMITTRAAAPSIRVTRARGITGRMVAWACPVAVGRGGAPLPCTTKVTFTRVGTLRLAGVPAADRGRLRVVVKRLGR